MRTFLDAPQMAKALRAGLAETGIDLPQERSLDLVAAQFGCEDWAMLSARIAAEEKGGPGLSRAIPILRIFDVDKAREFYLDFLGFALDWEHRYGDNFPLYCQVSRSDLLLHLSEHGGDGSPGANLIVEIKDVDSLHKELTEKDYRYMKPGITEQPWGRELGVIDPFGNRIHFLARLPRE